MKQSQKPQQPELHLMGKSLEDTISFIEELTGEKMTPEEIEELRQILASEGSSQSKAG